MTEILYRAQGDNSGVIASEDVPRKMKAVLALGKEGGDRKGKPLGFEFREEYDTPGLEAGEVLLRVEYSGICHTDLLCLDGILVVDKPRIPGHEFAGTIVAAAPGVDTKYLNKTMVALALYGGTGPQPNLSRESVFTGVAVDGGFAEYFRIKPEHLVAVPEGVSTKQAFAAGDALMTSRHAVDRVIRFSAQGESLKIVVYGATGGLGVATLINLLGAGVEPQNIYAVDIRQQYLDKLKDNLGVNCFNSEGKPVANEIRQQAGGKVDAVIDCFASAGNIGKAYTELENLVKNGIGDQEDQFNKKTLKNWLINNFQNQGTISDAYSIVRNGGHVEVIGSRGDHLLRPSGKFMETEVTSCGPWGGTSRDAETVLQFIEDEKITDAQLNLLLGLEQPFTRQGFSEGVDALRKSQIMGRVFFKM